MTWSCPPSGTVTLNTDGSYAADCGAGIGIVARDSLGQVIYGLAQHSTGPTEAEFAKHSALLAGLQLALDHGWPRVLVEKDSTHTVNMLGWSPLSDLSIFGPSLEPIRDILTAHPHIHLWFIPRSVNRIAHMLASWALHYCPRL
ncbi:hypothetical protein V6N11_056824 [Hibiscus sabdariffa]|uniref:RNase H type-1 domain-containing protein n=1 Tax=Hibiscus sabdariffa TaxID=183260 RepID=A0ABR2T589_9ROSI